MSLCLANGQAAENLGATSASGEIMARHPGLYSTVGYVMDCGYSTSCPVSLSLGHLEGAFKPLFTSTQWIFVTCRFRRMSHACLNVNGSFVGFLWAWQ